MWLEISSPFLAAPKSKSDRNNSDLDGLNEFDEQEDHPDLTDEDGLVIDEMGSTEAVTIEISSVRPSGNVLENKGDCLLVMWFLFLNKFWLNRNS